MQPSLSNEAELLEHDLHALSKVPYADQTDVFCLEER